MEAFNEYVVAMEDRVEVSRNGKEIESIGSEIRRLLAELETTKREGKQDAKKIKALTDDWRRTCQENATLVAQVVAQRARIAALEVEKDRDIRRASRVARHDVVGRCRVVLESLKEKWVNKKKEASAEIQLQVVVANIDLLNELKDGSLNVDAELAHLREMEKDCEGLVALGTISDWSIFGLDLPQVSEDSVDQAGGSSIPDGIDSSSFFCFDIIFFFVLDSFVFRDLWSRRFDLNE